MSCRNFTKNLTDGIIIRQNTYQNFIKILSLYRYFFLDLAIKPLKNIDINKHAIKLVINKQLFYKSIYILN